MAGFQGFAIEQGGFLAPDPLRGLKGFTVDEGQGIAINPQLGNQGFVIEKIVRRLNSLLFANLLPFVSNPRLDNLTVTLPDGRVFALGSNLAYGTISVPFCFFDEADEGSIEVTGTRRATWPNSTEYVEPFMFMI